MPFWIDGMRRGATHDWAQDAFQPREKENRVDLVLDEGDAPAIEKQYALEGERLEVRYRLSSTSARRGALEIEVNLGLHVFRADDRWVEVDGRRAEAAYWGAEEQKDGVRAAAFIDAWADRRLEIDIDRPAAWSRRPIETISLSEEGAEAVFQGVETRYRFEVEIPAGGEWQVRFHLRALRAAEVPA
jgi:hypothetical protein